MATYTQKEINAANKTIARVHPIDNLMEAIWWSSYRKKANPKTLTAIALRTDNTKFITFAGDAMLLEQHTGHALHPYEFGDKECYIAVIDWMDTLKIVAALKTHGYIINFINPNPEYKEEEEEEEEY